MKQSSSPAVSKKEGKGVKYTSVGAMDPPEAKEDHGRDNNGRGRQDNHAEAQLIAAGDTTSYLQGRLFVPHAAQEAPGAAAAAGSRAASHSVSASGSNSSSSSLIELTGASNPVLLNALNPLRQVPPQQLQLSALSQLELGELNPAAHPQLAAPGAGLSNLLLSNSNQQQGDALAGELARIRNAQLQELMRLRSLQQQQQGTQQQLLLAQIRQQQLRQHQQEAAASRLSNLGGDPLLLRQQGALAPAGAASGLELLLRPGAAATAADFQQSRRLPDDVLANLIEQYQRGNLQVTPTGMNLQAENIESLLATQLDATGSEAGRSASESGIPGAASLGHRVSSSSSSLAASKKRKAASSTGRKGGGKSAKQYQQQTSLGQGHVLDVVHYKERKPAPLGIDEDENWLSPFQTFVRAELMEVVRASQFDVMVRSTSKSIYANQVGVRCRYCAHLPPGSRVSRSSAFPSSMDKLYQSFSMMVRDHFLNCDEVPEAHLKKFSDLKKKNAQGATDSKQYWVYAAQKLGMAENPRGNGIEMTEASQAAAASMPPYGLTKEIAASMGVKVGDSDSNSVDEKPVPVFVTEADRPKLTVFLFELLSHFTIVHLLPSERVGKRKGLPLGLEGLGCKYCFQNGRLGFSRSFPLRRRALPAHIFDLYQHCLRCNLCPNEVKTHLQEVEKANPTNFVTTTSAATDQELESFSLIWEKLGRKRDLTTS